jgi:molybdopterin molybdotransferase
MLQSLLAQHGRAASRTGPVADRLDALMAALDAQGEADIIVTRAASVGDHDLIRPALEQWGAQIDFWRVAMRPGKPLMVARRGETLVLDRRQSGFQFRGRMAVPFALAARIERPRPPAAAPCSGPCARGVGPGRARQEYVRGAWDGQRHPQPHARQQRFGALAPAIA